MASKKTVELRKAKEKRQKLIAIGGAVLLVAVLAVQLPKLMSHPGTKTTPLATGTSTPATAAVAGAPTTSSTPASTGSSTTAVLVTSDVPAEADPGQLVVFDRFQSKDPFIQQLSEQSSTGSASASATTASATGQTAPKTALTSSATPSVTATVISPAKTTAATTTGKTVVISTNGKAEHVQVGASFPSAGPLFLLVSATNSSAKIAVAGGSYADGSATVTLTKGKPLTLMDTNTHEQYVLLFVSG
ncbi:MAG TPA: hypothetical protein VH108_06740 [Gaiellaceae bacterium]|jgi:hypothetical protein|nr:hypothetical protein [Gaiellaceae bacterium]